MLDSSAGLLMLVALVACSAYFSATETAFASLNRIRIKNYAEEGDKRANTVLKIADDFQRALSTVLIGNNVVNIASASIATLLFSRLMGPEQGAALSTVVMTIVVLIFGEILPKTYAKENSETLALRFAGPLSLLMKLLSPLVFLFVKLTDCITKPENASQPSVTEEELKYIVESIEEEGVLEEKESDLVQSALDFDEIEVQEIVTPRVDIVAIDIQDSWEEILTLAKDSTVSRFPVYEKTLDHVVGAVHVRDILKAQITGETQDVRTLMNDVLFVHKTMRISKLLDQLRRQTCQMAIVTDDYGGTLGLVTMEDLLEELVGEIWDEYDDVKEEFTQLDENTFLISGDANVYDVMEELDCGFKDFESEYNTISGWTLEMMEHIPQVGESFTFRTLTVVVEEMDDQRITKLRVIRHKPAEGDENAPEE